MYPSLDPFREFYRANSMHIITALSSQGEPISMAIKNLLRAAARQHRQDAREGESWPLAVLYQVRHGGSLGTTRMDLFIFFKRPFSRNILKEKFKEIIFPTSSLWGFWGDGK